MKLVERRLVPVAAPVVVPIPAAVATPVKEPSCVVCGKKAEDDLPYCSLQCECQAKYEEDVEWQDYQARKMKKQSADDDDEDEIQQLMRLRS